MCAACDAVEARSAAARRLSMNLQAAGAAEALAAVLPLERGIPYDMAVILTRLDEKNGGKR